MTVPIWLVKILLIITVLICGAALGAILYPHTKVAKGEIRLIFMMGFTVSIILFWGGMP